MVQGANGRCDFVVMNPVLYAMYHRAMSLKGVTVPTEWDPVLRTRVPMHDGVPILRSRFIPIGTTEPVGVPPATINTNMYAGVLGYGEGLFGMFNADLGENGVKVTELGPMEDANAFKYLVEWSAGLGFCGQNSLARVTYTGTQVPAPISA